MVDADGATKISDMEQLEKALSDIAENYVCMCMYICLCDCIVICLSWSIC